MIQKLQVVCDWDDGAAEDTDLVILLRRYGVKATFNLCSGLLSESKRAVRKNIYMMTRAEALETCRGFTVGNHTTEHVSLSHTVMRNAVRAVEDGRKQLQDIFGQPVLGLAYPSGLHDRTVWKIARNAGHLYGRGSVKGCQIFSAGNHWTVRPDCAVDDKLFWNFYEGAKKGSGVFWFYGHSWSIGQKNKWMELEKILEKISSDPEAEWKEIAELPWSI
jgi:peptidoglycan/xylan/chitin deacetylase (PgdA/CDA1 family)